MTEHEFQFSALSDLSARSLDRILASATEVSVDTASCGKLLFLYELESVAGVSDTRHDCRFIRGWNRYRKIL